MMEVPTFLLSAVAVLWTLGLVFPPVGHRRFVWALGCASVVPAFLAYKWITAVFGKG